MPAVGEAPVAIVLQSRADVDGAPGEEDLVLHADGTLVAGRWQGKAELNGVNMHWTPDEVALRVVMLDRQAGTRVVLLELPTDEEEDPPNRVQLFVMEDDRLRQVLDWTPGGYGLGRLEFPGDGSAEYVENGWTACDRAKHPATPVPLERVTLRMTGAPRAEQLVEVKRTATEKLQRCDELAACPLVYVLAGEQAIYVGELLRNLRGVAAYDRQTLALPAAGGGTLRVRIAEEKPEVTHLDAIALSVDGELLLPVTCGRASRPDYCAVDQAAVLLGPGETLDLEFDVPRDAREIELVGWGFYLPQW